MSLLATPDRVARMFIGLPVPEQTRGKLAEIARGRYGEYFEKLVPEGNWHMTLFFLGNVRNPGQYIGRLEQPMPQTFVPTLTLTHIGRGEPRDQLWAYGLPAKGLLDLRAAIGKRLGKIRFPHPVGAKKFTPHIRLANMYPTVRSMGVADTPVREAYAIREAYLYSSSNKASHVGSQYTIEATIRF